MFMGFSRQGYRSGLLFPPPGDLSNPGIEPTSPALAGEFFTNAPPGQSGSRDHLLKVIGTLCLAIIVFRC